MNAIKRSIRKFTQKIKKSQKKGGISTAKRPTKAQVEQSLMDQLAAKEALEPHFVDLVADYMRFRDIAKKLEDDIRKRGITYEETLSTGVKKVITNPSIKDRVAVSKQMNAILDKLGISPETNISGGGDEL